jgi:hypothetical protein
MPEVYERNVFQFAPDRKHIVSALGERIYYLLKKIILYFEYHTKCKQSVWAKFRILEC